MPPSGVELREWIWGCGVRLATVGLMTLAMCGSLLLDATSASANWGGPITVSPASAVPLGAVDNKGVLHTDYAYAPIGVRARTVHADVFPDGRVTASHSALDRSGLPSSSQTPATSFTFLGNGDAVRCALKGNLNTTGNLSAYFYSPGGALIRTVELAAADDVFDLNGEDGCEVVSTGESAAIVWVVAAPDISAPHQPGRQLMLSRILPGPTLTPPVPVLPTGADQLTGVDDGFPQESIAITKTGWVALAWPYISISKEIQKSVTQTTQWRARWISPAGELGPVVPLEQPRSGTCRLSSCGALLDTTFYLGAVADQKVMVVAGSKATWGTLDTAGAVSARVPLPTHSFPPGSYTQVSFGDYKAILAWWAGSYKSSLAVEASVWSGGRWSRPHQLASGRGSNPPYPSEALMSQHGEGCVTWSRTTALGFDAGAYAEFDS